MSSKGELELEELLRSEYPRITIKCQFPIKVGSRTTLFIDYFIPALRLAFEVDGKQHMEQITHFHKNRRAFLHGKTNDYLKEQWCQENEITLLRFSHKESINKQTLYAKIQNSFRTEQ